MSTIKSMDLFLSILPSLVENKRDNSLPYRTTFSSNHLLPSCKGSHEHYALLIDLGPLPLSHNHEVLQYGHRNTEQPITSTVMKCTHVSLRPYYFRAKNYKPIKRVLKNEIGKEFIEKRVQLELVL